MTSDTAIRKAANFVTVFNKVLGQSDDGELLPEKKKSFVKILDSTTK